MSRLVTLWIQDGAYKDGHCELRHFYDTRMTAEAFEAEIQRIKKQKLCDLLTITYSGKRIRPEIAILVKPDNRPERIR